MNTTRYEGHAQLLFTRTAVSSFSRLFSPPMDLREAKRTLVRLSGRTRTIHREAGPHGLQALVPDGVDGLVLYAHALPGLQPLVVSRVGVIEDDEYEEEPAPGRRAA